MDVSGQYRHLLQAFSVPAKGGAHPAAWCWCPPGSRPPACGAAGGTAAAPPCSPAASTGRRCRWHSIRTPGKDGSNGSCASVAGRRASTSAAPLQARKHSDGRQSAVCPTWGVIRCFASASSWSRLEYRRCRPSSAPPITAEAAVAAVCRDRPRSTQRPAAAAISSIMSRCGADRSEKACKGWGFVRRRSSRALKGSNWHNK